MNKKEVIANIKKWIELLVRIENKALNAKYFNRGLTYGLIIGIVASIWSALLYQEVLIKLAYDLRIIIFLLLSFVGIFIIIKSIYIEKDLSVSLEFLEVGILKMNDYLLEIRGIKHKGITMTLDDRTVERILGKNYRKQKWYKKAKKEKNKLT